MKVIMQSKREQANLSYRTEINTILAREGVYGFTRGYTGQFMRDCPGFAIYFGLFEWLKISLQVS